MAPDKDRISWLLLICVAVTLTGESSAESRQQIPKPRTCDSAETWFRHRRSFVYNYVATVIAGFSGTSSTVTGSRLSCEVTVNVPKRCEIVMQLSGCILKETGLDDKPVVSKKSKQLAKLLNRYEVYVQMDRGSVLEQRLLVDEREPVYILNIKRAIISQMQLPILPWKQYDKPLLLHDHFGTCPTEVSLEGQSKSLKTRRDISQCSLTQLFGRQLHPMSFAKQFEIHVLQRPISEVVYPFESKVECQYKIGNNRITASTCQHGQIFKPITFDGELTAATAVNVTQSLTLTSARKLSRKKAAVNRHLNGRQFVDLTMQLEVDPPQVVSSSRLLQALEDIIAASFKPSTSADENMVPEKFRSFVDLARNVKSKELGEALEAILACRETEKCGLPELSSGQMAATALQKQRELFFTDGIFTCGTEACVATYLDCVQRGDVVSSLEAEVTLLNMALFYQPAPAVLTSMLALCKSSNTSSSNCWLTLGTLTGRLAQTLGQHAPAQQQEGQAAVSRVLQGMRQMMGDICIPGALARTPRPQQPATLSHLLLALKSLANAGEVLNGSKDGEDLMIAAVLQCVNNTDLPNSVATAALNVLSKVDLKPPIHVALTTLLGDRARPVAHRTMAFDRLVRHHNVSTVHHLADVIVREKLVSLQTYMVTRVGHLLESNNPKEYSLRTVWRSVLKTKPLPVLEQLKGRGSQYAEFSRYVEHPLSKHLLGAKLGIGVVFEPSNLVPSQLRVSVSSVLFNHSVELLEVGVDMQGMENIARELLTQGLYPADGMGAGVARLVQAMLPKTGETPTLFFQDMKVMEALKKLMTRINMPSGDTVQAQFHVKVFGSEVGFVDAQDVVRIVRGQKQSMGRGRQHAGVTTWAQKLAEGLKLFVGKSSNLVEVVRMFPTVAGLPWRAQVHGTMVASASFNAGGDVAKFLTRKGPLKIAGDAAASVGVRVLCEESVAIGDLTSSGVRLNISVLVKGGAEGRMRLGPRPGSKLPQGGKVLELGLGATKEPFTFISARSDIYQMHNGEQRMITTPRTQVPMDMCVPGFVQRWSGQVLCLKGFYQHVPIKPNNPMPIVSGPVHLDVTIKRVDKSLKEYTAAFLLKQEQMKDQSSPLIDFGANFSAAGDKLKRQLEVSVKVSPESKAIQGRVRVPEFGLRYSLDLSTSLDAPGTPRLKGASGGTDVHHLLSSVLSVGPDVMHSMILEVQNKTIGVDNSFLKVMLLKANMSMPGLSLEVSANSSVAQNPGLTTSQGLYMRYYCQPHYGLLYTLHGKPKLAASNGHVSTWSITNVARIQGQFLSDTWRAADIMTILAPGHNITLTNQITANFTWASRRSKLFWTYGLGTPNVSTDLITMDAEVRNESVGRHQNLHYVMQLDHKDKYDVMVEGSLRGPVSNMAFQTDIVYTSKAIRAGRERRSLRSIANRLKRLEERAEEAVETIEEMVIRRGAELTEAFLKWMAEEPASKSQKQDGVKTTGVAEITSVATPVASGATVGQLNVGFLASIFRRRSWKMDIDANLKYKPRKELGSARPVGYDLQWDLHVHLPHLNNDLLFFNGTLNRLPRYSCGMDWRFHSDVLNFTLAYFLQQRIAYPAVYHWHHWKLVEFTKHRYDRSFSFLLDLERDDHFMYHMLLVSPRTNLTHQINYSLPNPQLHTVRAIFNLHHEDPVFDIKWREKSNLTPKGLTTDVSLNSTWLNMVLDSDVDWSTPGALMVTQRLDTLGRVSPRPLSC
ncbi:apolipoprotein B-100-like isoform X2 [Babylonia areolata]|uniref:apolipoprotein B-100-like isoform X2 n=1 Tax=Babylonia areolata TaxID=304850 RepID=UPI003FD362D5